MTLFTKKPPQPRLLADRVGDFRAAVEKARAMFEVPPGAAIATLEDLARNLKMGAAMSAPASGTPRTWSGANPRKLAH
jgi:hypothetical protein